MTDYSGYTNKELTVFLKEGDHAAYAEIYDRFQCLLYVYACKIVKDQDEAEDIVQEIFISLWEKRNDIDFHTSLSSYLYCAVRYKFINLLDRKKVRSDYSTSLQKFIDQGDFVTDDYIREKELHNIIEQQICLLPEKMRQIFIMSRKQNKSNKEIADELSKSEKTVRNQVNNALNILRVKLGLLTFLILIEIYK